MLAWLDPERMSANAPLGKSAGSGNEQIRSWMILLACGLCLIYEKKSSEARALLLAAAAAADPDRRQPEA